MGRRDRNNGSTNSRESARCRGGGYRMVSSDGGHENVSASSDHTGVILITTQMAFICWGGVNKVLHV